MASGAARCTAHSQQTPALCQLKLCQIMYMGGGLGAASILHPRRTSCPARRRRGQNSTKGFCCCCRSHRHHCHCWRWNRHHCHCWCRRRRRCMHSHCYPPTCGRWCHRSSRWRTAPGSFRSCAASAAVAAEARGGGGTLWGRHGAGMCQGLLLGPRSLHCHIRSACPRLV